MCTQRPVRHSRGVGRNIILMPKKFVSFRMYKKRYTLLLLFGSAWDGGLPERVLCETDWVHQQVTQYCIIVTNY